MNKFEEFMLLSQIADEIEITKMKKDKDIRSETEKAYKIKDKKEREIKLKSLQTEFGADIFKYAISKAYKAKNTIKIFIIKNRNINEKEFDALTYKELIEILMEIKKDLVENFTSGKNSIE